jgi:molybdenum cofactor guanylyltransferase
MSGKISGVILAGGAGKRFNGRQKAKAQVDGITIISRILSVFTGIFDEIIIVTNTPDEFSEFTGCIIVSDTIRGAGPLGGIHAAMKASSGDAVFVIAGDMPFPDSDIIRTLIETYSTTECDGVIPETDGRIEPLHAIYSVSVTEKLQAYLAGNMSRAVREFIKDLNIKYLHTEDSPKIRKAFTNINSIADLDRFNGKENI